MKLPRSSRMSRPVTERKTSSNVGLCSSTDSRTAPVFSASLTISGMRCPPSSTSKFRSFEPWLRSCWPLSLVMPCVIIRWTCLGILRPPPMLPEFIPVIIPPMPTPSDIPRIMCIIRLIVPWLLPEATTLTRRTQSFFSSRGRILGTSFGSLKVRLTISPSNCAFSWSGVSSATIFPKSMMSMRSAR